MNNRRKKHQKTKLEEGQDQSEQKGTGRESYGQRSEIRGEDER
jgi:hypothetical protein